MRTIQATFYTLLTVVFCGTLGAQTSRLTLDIDPQPMRLALKDLGEQTGLQIMFRAEDVATDELRAPRISGLLSAEEALEKMLADSPLKYRFVNPNTVLISGKDLVGLEKAASTADGAMRFAQTNASSADATSSEAAQGSQEKESGNSAESAQLEEIVVTAQKREERLQDVPISISVLAGDDLDASTTEGVTEALSRVPGVAINVNNLGGGTQVAVRGVAAGGALFNGSSPISYYLDSVPFGLVRQAIGPDTNAYDLERVEVLRGPQGTLYGANAQNGVVRVLTKDANLNAFEFKARTSASATDGGGANYRGDAAINVPIVDGKLAARAVLGYQDLSGWIDRLNKKDVNDAQLRNVRLKLNAQPTGDFSIGASVWRSRSDYGGASISDDDAVRIAIFPEPISTDFDAYGIKLGYELPGVSISSMTSYLDYTNDSIMDETTLLEDLTEQTRLTADVLSQEIILNSTHEGAWRWSLGGMYRDAEDRQVQTAFIGTFVIPEVDQTYISKSYAVFGELTRQFLDGRIELTGGLRYFEDDVTSQDDLGTVRGGNRFDALSPRAVLTWHPNDNSTAYASYAEGFRSGFPQSGFLLANAPQFPPLDADTLHNYEVGAKRSIWNGRLSFETAVFYIDWQDVQQSLTVPVTDTTLATALINGESASGVGFEFGATTRPVQGLELGVNFSWNDLTMDSEVRSFPNGGPPEGVILFEKGDRLNISPEYTASASADYSFPLGASGLRGGLAASVNYTSGMDSRTIVAPNRSIALGDSMLISRASFAIRAPTHWTATLFVDNLNNEDGSPVRFPFFHDFLPWDTRVRPRTLGVQFEYVF